MLIIGMAGYLTAEFVDRRERKLLIMKEVDDSKNGIAMLDKEKDCTKKEIVNNTL